MIKNYIDIAWRNLLKNKGFSAINIFGLALGLSICFLITVFVVDELSYDRYNKYADRIFRVNTDIHINNTSFNDRVTSAPMAAALAKDFPQIEQATRIMDNSNVLIKKGNETLIEKQAFFADSNLFKVFTLPVIAGDLNTALKNPHSLVLSESLAMKYFNSTNIIGKTLLLDNGTLCKVTAVIKDTPFQSHLHFNLIRSTADVDAARSAFWLSNNFSTYVLVKPGITQEMLDNYLDQAARKYAEPQVFTTVHTNFHELEKMGGHYRLLSIPLLKIHLYSNLNTELEPHGNIEYVYIFMIIAALILFIACVNFMNLSTARSASRAKEVGVRKVIGSSRSDLIRQFLTESVLTSFLAFILAIGIAFALLPFLNDISGKALSISNLSSLWLFLGLIVVTAIVGLAAGSYPAFYLSGFEPVEVLKGKLASGLKGSWLRNGLVVFQFFIAIVLIIGTLVIYSQLRYIRSKDLGYNRDQVIILKNAYSMGGHAETFRKQVLALGGVVSGTRTNSLPTANGSEWNRNTLSKSSTMAAGQMMTFVDWYVDPDYVPTLGIKMVQGRNFSSQMPTDSSAILINETAARMLGFKNPLNEKLYAFGDNGGKNISAHTIVGVIKDMNIGSVRFPTEPLIMEYSKFGDRFCFRVNTRDMPGLISKIEEKYHAVDQMAGQPFEYSFMDQDFNKLYDAEQRTGKIFFSFAFFAILISCLGLFGLVTYAAEQRTKEIGIRKVLGASLSSVITLLSVDFMKLILISAVIAFPIGWFGMNQWLSGFSNHTTIGVWIFIVAGALAFFITLITTGVQAVKAALANPVDSIRTE